MTFSQLVVNFFSVLTLIGQILGVGLIAALFAFPRVRSLIAKNYIGLTLLVSGLATFGSLFFSLILGFVPCELCWYQRIFMYPLAVISFVAYLKNDARIQKYIIPLSVIGALIATYHTLLQIFPTVFQCSDEVAKCSFKQFAFLGYITIPVMALTAFVMIILINIISLRAGSKK